jgi:hypothetical protein
MEWSKEATMKNLLGKSLVKMLALALGIASTQSAAAQSFKHVSVKGGVALAQIAAGGASVWALARNGNPYILKGRQFVLANSISLTQLAVGGGNALQADAVWGLDSSGNIYSAAKSGTSWIFNQMPGVLDFIAVGIGYNDSCHPYEVWGLNSAAEIYRYDFCIQNWDQVGGTLGSLAVGGGDIWGVNGLFQLFRFDFATLTFMQKSILFTQVTVGPNGVWTLQTDNSVYEFDDHTQVFFLVSPTLRLTQIQAGGNGVWGIDSSQQIFRLEPSTWSFVQIPGALVSISVGTGGGVWGVNAAGQAYGFSTP